MGGEGEGGVDAKMYVKFFGASPQNPGCPPFLQILDPPLLAYI